jgi:hypothetical protein
MIVNHSRIAVVIGLATAIAITNPVLAHEAHMLIGHSSAGQLVVNTADGIQNNTSTVLNLIPPGGFIEGYSASIPGFSLVLNSEPEVDCYPLATGADVWLELVAIDSPLLVIETPSYLIINEQDPPVMQIGGEATAHVHPLWLLDTLDPAFDSMQCVWEASFVLRDNGSTGYADSEMLTFRFSAGQVPCTADYDCDRDVDSDDFAICEQCVTGPSIWGEMMDIPPSCSLLPSHRGSIAADLDADNDVDLHDLAKLQLCYRGEDTDCDPDCTGVD